MIFGDGNQTRDFTYIENVVQANLRAAVVVNPEAYNTAYNVAFGDRVTLQPVIYFPARWPGENSIPALQPSSLFPRIHARGISHIRWHQLIKRRGCWVTIHCLTCDRGLSIQ